MSETGPMKATIAVSSKGEQWGQIVLRFFPDVAPNHVKNFATLAKQSFITEQPSTESFPGS